MFPPAVRNKCVLFALLLCIAPALLADELSAWLDTAAAKPYLSEVAALRSIFDGCVGAGVPGALLIERLQEGAAKRVPPPRLLEAVTRDGAGFVFLALLYRRTSAEDAGQTVSEQEFIRRGALSLRAGAPQDLFEELFLRQPRSGSMARKLDALLAVSAVNSRFRLSAGEMETLCLALITSSERESRFSRLSSIFVRGISGGLDASAIVDLAALALGGKGTLARLENEILRRKR